MYSRAMAYPVTVDVQPLVTGRNRLTTAFRLILAIPHLILVGGVGLGVASRGDSGETASSEGGLLGAVAVFLAIVSWFTIVFTGRHIAGIRQFTALYLRWRVRALAYVMLLEDAYPPFGDGPYPAIIDVADPVEPRDRLSVGLRLLLAIPHFIALIFVLLAWACTTIVSVVHHPVHRRISAEPVRLWYRRPSLASPCGGVHAPDGGRLSAVLVELRRAAHPRTLAPRTGVFFTPGVARSQGRLALPGAPAPGARPRPLS